MWSEAMQELQTLLDSFIRTSTTDKEKELEEAGDEDEEREEEEEENGGEEEERARLALDQVLDKLSTVCSTMTLFPPSLPSLPFSSLPPFLPSIPIPHT